jgi:hypothetical protein
MGWENRERGGHYYTRSRKVDGRVVREYLGGGLIGELAARFDEAEREKRKIVAARMRFEQARLEALAAPVVALCEVAEVLCRAALVDGGYRRYQGKWRRKREQRTRVIERDEGKAQGAPDPLR